MTSRILSLMIERLLIVLKDWLAHHQMKRLTAEVRRKPLRFKKGFSAAQVRELNRRRS